MTIEPIGRFWPVDGEGRLVRTELKAVAPWTDALQAAVNEYRRITGPRLHSVYVRGSAAEGRARPGISDLDTFAVVNETATGDRDIIHAAARDLERRFPFCAGVETALVALPSLMSDPAQAFRRFQVKVLGACAAGEDLAERLPTYRPGKDTLFVRPALRALLRDAASYPATERCCRWVARAIVRAGFDLVLEREGRYTRDLHLCYTAFADHYPAFEGRMREALELAIAPSSDWRGLAPLGDWLCRAAPAGPRIPPHYLATPLPEGTLLLSESANLLVPETLAESAPADPHAAWWSLKGVAPAESRERLDAARVAVHALDPRFDEPMRRALAGIRIDADARVAVVVAPDVLSPELEAWAERAWEERRPWLLVRPTGAEIWVGPVFMPGRTACASCLAARLRQSSPLHASVDAPLPPVPLQEFAAGAFEIAAREIADWIVVGGLPRLAGTLLSVDTRSWTTRQHVLVGRPSCARCGRPRTPASFELQGRPYDPSASWHRASTAEETVERYQRHVSPLLGAVRTLERDTRFGELHVYQASLNPPLVERPPLETSRILAGGKGTSDMNARASALAEALERYASFVQGDELLVRGLSLREAGARAMAPASLLMFSEQQYRDREKWNAVGVPFCRVPERLDPDARLDWSRAWSLTRKEERLVPAALALNGRVPGRAMLPWESSGGASGNVFEEALLHGLLELVERDATSIWWYNRLRRPGLDLAAIDDPWVQWVRSRVEAQGRRVWALDLTSDLGIPSAGAFCEFPGAPHRVVFGFGAHLSMRAALARAINEMVQCFAVEENALGQAAPTAAEALLRRWLTTAGSVRDPWLAPSGTSRGAELLTGDWRDDVELCRQRLEVKGLEVLVVDLTRPEIGLPTVKALVPGLRSIRRRLAPGRLYDVPVKEGRLPAATPESGVNPEEFIL